MQILRQMLEKSGEQMSVCNGERKKCKKKIPKDSYVKKGKWRGGSVPPVSRGHRGRRERRSGSGPSALAEACRDTKSVYSTDLGRGGNKAYQGKFGFRKRKDHGTRRNVNEWGYTT